MILAQLTDTHVLEPGTTQFIDNNAMLVKAVESLNAERPAPAAVLGSGDLVNGGTAEQYAALAEMVGDLSVPFLPMIGNHDDRALLKRTFPDMPWVDAEHASWVIELDGVSIVAIDTKNPESHGARFDGDRPAWLTDTLAATPSPIILAMHHPPFTTGLTWMDDFGFGGLDTLHDIVAEHQAKIIRIVCGHFHRPLVATFAGVTTSVCPSIVHHMHLDLMPASAAKVVLDPRGYQLHLINGSDVVTHTRHIDTGLKPFDPGWEYD